MSTPEDRRYTEQHEWAQVQAPEDGATVVRVGITDHAQDALGDIVFVQLPDVGTEVTVGTPIGEVESTKSVSDVYAPVAGVVAARNEALEATPELVNTGPYEAGWMIEVRLADGAVPGDLLDAAGYQELTSG